MRITTTTFDIFNDRPGDEEPGAGGAAPTPPPGDGGNWFESLPGWSLPFVGALAMLAAILLATGMIRFAISGVPAIGRGFGRLAYKTSNTFGRLSAGPRRPRQSGMAGGLWYRLLRPFRRPPRAHKTQRPGLHRGAAGWWDRLLVKMRMSRSGITRTRAGVDSQKRYWQLRFRRWIPWRR